MGGGRQKPQPGGKENAAGEGLPQRPRVSIIPVDSDYIFMYQGVFFSTSSLYLATASSTPDATDSAVDLAPLALTVAPSKSSPETAVLADIRSASAPSSRDPNCSMSPSVPLPDGAALRVSRALWTAAAAAAMADSASPLARDLA